jgi:hypothetical protein
VSVLRELDYSDADIQDLQQKGVVRTSRLEGASA